MKCHGVRGAISVDRNDENAIVAATRKLLEQIVAANRLSVDDVAAVVFTATPDLDAAYPARAARELGWTHTPLLCMQEMMIEGSLSRCVRVLVLWNTGVSPDQIRHVYLGDARRLRPDLSNE